MAKQEAFVHMRTFLREHKETDKLYTNMGELPLFKGDSFCLTEPSPASNTC